MTIKEACELNEGDTVFWYRHGEGDWFPCSFVRLYPVDPTYIVVFIRDHNPARIVVRIGNCRTADQHTSVHLSI